MQTATNIYMTNEGERNKGGKK